MQSIRPIIESWKAGHISKTEDTDLCSVYKKHGSDKKSDGGSRHNYTNLYYPLFQLLRNQAFNFFELGLGTHDATIAWHMGPEWKVGASMYAAEEFFPNANIYGADIDSAILFNERRIKTFYCNSKDATAITTMWNDPELKDKKFEIILDDACHEFDANFCFAVNSIPKLAPQGMFIIEDLLDTRLAKFAETLPFLIEKFNLDVCELITMRGATALIMQVK